MSTVVAPPLDSFEMPPFPVHRWTVAEYHELLEAGLLNSEARVELLEGWIVPKVTHNPIHDSVVQSLLRPLLAALPAGWDLRFQSAIETSDSEPEPDVAVVRGDSSKYRERHPGPGEVGLAIEVADSSLRKDRRKATIYAAAEVASYWIINLADRQLEVFEHPEPLTRLYTHSRIVRPGESLELMLDGQSVARFSVDQFLPPG